MNRRTFLRGALRTAAAASAGGAGLLLRGCSKGKDLDLLVASARSGKSPYEFTRDLLAEETGRVGMAAHLGFVRRGMLKVGWAADVCVFDPARVADRATFAEPAVYPDGIEKVVVNGEVVVDAGTHTGRLPGKLLRKNARGEVA